MNLPEGLIALLRQPSLCFLATAMPDGSPQVTRYLGTPYPWYGGRDEVRVILTIEAARIGP